MSRKSKYFTGIILVAIIAVLIFCAIRIFMIRHEYGEGRAAYEKLEDFVNIVDDTDETDTEQDRNSKFLEIDFNGLKEKYPDIIGWIEFRELEFSYPILQGKDNHYYLNHLPDGQTGKCGSIFLDYHNDTNFGDLNSIIYGHNMKDGSMFSSLRGFKDLSEKANFYIYTPDTVLEYQIISAYQGRASDQAYTYYFSEEKHLTSFLDTILKSSELGWRNTGYTGNRVVTLSTCDNQSSYGRYIVHGKLVRQIGEVGNEG